jgi:hypothetical protein
MSDAMVTPNRRKIGPGAKKKSIDCIIPRSKAVKIAVDTDDDRSDPDLPATKDVEHFIRGSLYNLLTEY